MRARHRHFNYAAMGASAVYDARFLALADSDAVSSWTDRSASGNNATQTGSERPTFKANEFNGQPGIQFTSAGQSSLVLTNSINVANTSETLLVSKKTALSSIIALSTDTSVSDGAIVTDFFYNQFYIIGTSGAGVFANTSSASPAVWMASPDNRILLNGVAQSVSGVNVSGANATRIGRRVSQYSNGHLGLVAYFGSALTAASRKRAQHAAAYSFKIACS